MTPIEFPQLSDCFIHYFIQSDREKAREYFKTKGYTFDCHGNGGTLCEQHEDPIIWLLSKRYDVVLHEMIHAVFHMLKNIGIEKVDTLEIQEIFCYFVEYAVKQVLK